MSGRIVKWTVEISKFDIGYEPRNSIKAQAIKDFIQELMVDKAPKPKWLMSMDGSSTVGGSGGAIFLVSSEGDQLEYVANFRFRASNNEAEYNALIKEMEWR